ncbi:MAG: HAMP domain-containing protein [Candidatus Goldbacteria bacterium]|nr:HAMP domain-containing protein [Candidatus Goldiibacteriota bacterium]
MNRRKVKFSLQYKITGLIFALIIITMAVVLYYTINMNIENQQREIRKSASQIIDTLSALRLVTSIQSGGASGKSDWLIYEKYLNLLSKLDKNIIFMAILDEKSDIKAFSINYDTLKKDFKEIVIKEDKNEFAKEILTMKINDVLKMQENINIKGSRLSQVVIKFSKKPYIKKMYITIINLSILTFILLVVGFLGAWWLARFITKNFNIIAAGMRKVAEGNLNVEVNVKSNDEVGVLADDFNRMIVELREKVRIKDAFETVADGLKEMDDLKKAYKILTYQEMMDKITKSFSPLSDANSSQSFFVFIDISSFSSMAYELISEEMKSIIEKFVEKVSLTALEYQGAVLKVTENAIMISFGYPFMHSDDLKRAFISTVEIRKELISMVKGKLALGYNIEDFSVNFIIMQGGLVKNFIDGSTMERYKVITDYIKFASQYGEKKKYGTDVYATKEIAKGTDNLAVFEHVDNVSLPDGKQIELLKLKAVKF